MPTLPPTTPLPSPLASQKHRFAIPAGVHYLNCASRAPMSIATSLAGKEAIEREANPLALCPNDFFRGAIRVRELFSQLINNPDPERIAVVPSVSYGMAVVAQNLKSKPGLKAGQRIVLSGREFPSAVYPWDRACQELGLDCVTVPMPEEFPKGVLWNERMLEAITKDTAMVVVPAVHWIYGICFDLQAIGRRAREVGAWLVIDGTQSVGALPFDVETIKPDALVCASYKWLMGPYSMGLAYFSEAFDEGIPLEEAWMNRVNSDQFHQLTEYQNAYRPKAYRYNVGEHSHFLQMPMLESALIELLEWNPSRIQDYARDLFREAWPAIEKLGCRVEPVEDLRGRCHHLVGLWLPKQIDPIEVQRAMLAQRVSVSVRGSALRFSPHVYNDAEDVSAFLESLAKACS